MSENNISKNELGCVAGEKHCSRRAILKGGLGLAFGSSVIGFNGQISAEESSVEGEAKQNKINHSVMGWCFKPMPVATLIQHCKAIGLTGIEGISAEYYPLAKEAGLEISLVGSHNFARGPFNPDNREHVVKALREGIDRAKKFGSKRVITFTGMREPGISDVAGARNCVETWKSVIEYAEKEGIELCLEHLNSRATGKMKGHPGYFGDDVDFCVELIRKVDSPNMKLLFDIYHVQIMNGDIIRRIDQYQDVIGHYHTAGNPGRCELHEDQEINYPAVMRAILKTGYQGFVAHEFIPTWEDKYKSLEHGYTVCDV